MKAIIPVFTSETKRPIYLQLYDYIKESILSGEMSENEKLPSLRTLAKCAVTEPYNCNLGIRTA